MKIAIYHLKKVLAGWHNTNDIVQMKLVPSYTLVRPIWIETSMNNPG